MKTFFQRTLTLFGHLSDETITKLINGELATLREFPANAHLAKCWQCKARREALEKATFQVVEYRKFQIERRLPLDPRHRETFLTRLDEALAETVPMSWQTRLFSQFRIPSIPTMNPVYASTFVVAVAAVLLVLIWQRNAPAVSPQVFLEKAVLAETHSSSPIEGGVIYQKVEVRSKSKTIEVALYRDRSRRRKARSVTLSPEEQAARKELEIAGVDWQEPLSAMGFQQWHDSQPHVKDDVRCCNNGLMTMATSIPSGPISSESLTVRTKDFHVVSRTVSMRDDENIEIAEVHYDTLGWDSVNDALFAPLSGSGNLATAAGPVLPYHPDPAVMDEQLDLAELQARLVLNRMHADTTEQLEFSRLQTTIEVKGIVESNQRKQDLVAQLRTIPHVLPAIFSIDDLRAHGGDSKATSSIRAYSSVAGPSPLEQSLRAQGRGTDDLNATSQKILDAALSITQESTAIDDLYRHFGGNKQLDEAERSALQNLLDAHASRLRQAVDLEDAVLAEAGMSATKVIVARPILGTEKPSMGPTALRNMALSRELISGNDGVHRDATLIAHDLFISTQELRNALRTVASSSSTSYQAALPHPHK